jgi:hypothetical protein
MDVRQEALTRAANITTGGHSRGKKAITEQTPAAITATT